VTGRQCEAHEALPLLVAILHIEICLARHRNMCCLGFIGHSKATKPNVAGECHPWGLNAKSGKYASYNSEHLDTTLSQDQQLLFVA